MHLFKNKNISIIFKLTPVHGQNNFAKEEEKVYIILNNYTVLLIRIHTHEQIWIQKMWENKKIKNSIFLPGCLHR